jgi:sarcosine oxidase delta subunit
MNGAWVLLPSRTLIRFDLRPHLELLWDALIFMRQFLTPESNWKHKVGRKSFFKRIHVKRCPSGLGPSEASSPSSNSDCDQMGAPFQLMDRWSQRRFVLSPAPAWEVLQPRTAEAEALQHLKGCQHFHSRFRSLVRRLALPPFLRLTT